MDLLPTPQLSTVSMKDVRLSAGIFFSSSSCIPLIQSAPLAMSAASNCTSATLLCPLPSLCYTWSAAINYKGHWKKTQASSGNCMLHLSFQRKCLKCTPRFTKLEPQLSVSIYTRYRPLSVFLPVWVLKQIVWSCTSFRPQCEGHTNMICNSCKSIRLCQSPQLSCKIQHCRSFETTAKNNQHMSYHLMLSNGCRKHCPLI